MKKDLFVEIKPAFLLKTYLKKMKQWISTKDIYKYYQQKFIR